MLKKDVYKRQEVAKYTGHTVPNPWNFEDALTASAVYLSQLGAKANGAGEYNAASRYYLSLIHI